MRVLDLLLRPRVLLKSRQCTDEIQVGNLQLVFNIAVEGQVMLTELDTDR